MPPLLPQTKTPLTMRRMMEQTACKNPPPPTPALSPGMAQYFEIKSRHEDYILFYRMGDFYELFFDDAVTASGILDIALTKRGKVGDEDIPMCGVPVHAADQYLERLIAQGVKVAICEQLEDPAEAKKRGSKSVVRRDVVRIVTPGTLTEESLLAPAQANYLACLAAHGNSMALAWVDITTGEFRVSETSPARLGADLARLNPSELLVSDTLAAEQALGVELSSVLTILPAASFHPVRASEQLRHYYKLAALDAFGDLHEADLVACGALLDYIALTQKDAAPRLDAPSVLRTGEGMVIDAATRRNLELVASLSGGKKGSLLATIDRTLTAPGARLLANRLVSPLTDPHAISARLDAVAWMLEHTQFREHAREQLRACPDMERALGRLLMGRGSPRDMQAIRAGLTAATELRGAFLECGDALPLPTALEECSATLGEHSQLTEELRLALKDDLPLLARDGGFVRSGYHAALDEFRMLRDESKRLIAAMQARYAEQTGIGSLKIKYNNVLGYFIEITRLHEKKAPAEFIHRQTMKDALRYTTVELAEIEQKISEAADRALKIELEIFEELLARLRDYAETIITAARAIAALDVAYGFATLAEEGRYCRPQIDDSMQFSIIQGRHPVVEAAMENSGGRFIGNDCDLAPRQRLWLLTGPNMAGKSTFLRQNALISILAQTGSFVPAKEAKIGVVDRLFSRVGAADDLARGRSTFMVEMVETATILAQSTPRSLVILDEIGRGTATFDGLSIAWAVVEHLHNQIRCRGLFATHYHELTHLAGSLPSLACATMKVKEWKGEVIFLHEVKPGVADRSYGIHVARLAGLPEEVITRARHILQVLEQEQKSPAHALTTDALPLFASAKEEASDERRESSALQEMLASINPDTLSPKEALDALYALKTLVG